MYSMELLLKWLCKTITNDGTKDKNNILWKCNMCSTLVRKNKFWELFSPPIKCHHICLKNEN